MLKDFSTSIFLGLLFTIIGAMIVVGEMIEYSTNNPLSSLTWVATLSIFVGVFSLSYGLSKKKEE